MALRINGSWWTGRARRTGALEIDDDGRGTLRLTGAFPDFQSFESPQRGAASRKNLVRGLAADGRLFTLVDCVRTKTTTTHFQERANLQTTYDVGWYVVGHHFRSYASLRFSEIAFECDELNELIGASFISPHYTNDARRVRFAYNAPKPIEIAGGGVTITLKQRLPVQSSGSALRLQESASVSVRAKSPQHFDDLWEGPVVDIWSLLQFMAERRLSVRWISGRIGRAEARKDCEIVILRNQPEENRPSRQPHEFLFKMRALRGARLASVLRRWRTLRSSLSTVVRLYEAATNHGELFTELRFLILAQALETYQRSRRNRPPESAAKHARRLARVLGAVGEADRDWLKNALQWSNSATLRDRLRDLHEQVGVPLRDVLPPRDSFVSQVVDTRNFLTHYTEGKKNVLTGFALIDMTERLRWVVQFFLLRELGFSKEQATWIARGALTRHRGDQMLSTIF